MDRFRYVPQGAWSYAQMATLWELAREGLYASEIAIKLAMPETLIIEKATELGVPLSEPTVQLNLE
jgi:hypothetical protein